LCFFRGRCQEVTVVGRAPVRMPPRRCKNPGWKRHPRRSNPEKVDFFVLPAILKGLSPS
jgi:hypothetical protein